VPDADWLPDLETFSGEWQPYEDKIYAIYVADFITREASWRSKRITLRFNPPYKDKSFTYWHLTSESDGKGDRIPDLRRCERIRWPKAIIQAPPDAVRSWAQQRDKVERIGIAVPDFSYVLFLQPAEDRAHLLTAYYVERPSRREQYRNEWLANKR
jgi:hypothetical protein